MRTLVIIILMTSLCIAATSAAICEDATGTPAPTQQLAKPSDPGKPYTSLIVDATGLGLERSMSPKVRKDDGSEVWGTVKVDYDFIEEHGLVAYASSLEDAMKNDRCGENPMVVKAVGVMGKQTSDPLVAAQDANLIIDENKKSGFLDKLNVVFVKAAQPTMTASAK
ncbi:MAG: hypothetical protein ABFD54_15375 [Armatimonadota bacterium]|nr:hypothetical protein [bacterium]